MHCFRNLFGFIFCIFYLNSNAQFNQGNCPNNIDFELGNFTNWNLFAGTVSAGPGYNWTTFTQVANQHEILTSAANSGQTDTYGGFPVVCPNGSGVSIKLGNNLVNRGAERVSYTFTVPNGLVRYSLTYYYAVVFQNPPHTVAEQPRFTVNLVDVNSNLTVGCSYYDYAATSNLPGFQLSPLGTPTVPIYYKTWTPVTIDLSGQNGKTIKLEFTTNDCSLGGHFGYGYVDVGSTCITPVTGYAYCVGETSVTLTAPFGYQNYYWYDQNYLVTLGNAQTLTISPPPASGTVINLDLVPFPGFGCRDTLPVTVEEQPYPDTPVAASLVTYCQFQPATQLQAFPNPGYITQWYTVPSGGVPLSTPPTPSTTVVGNTDYYVSQKSFGGCEGPRKKVTVTILAPPIANFSINDTIQCFPGHQFIFTSTSSNVNAQTIYEWDFGDASGNVIGTTVTHNYALIGTYNVNLKVTSSTNCISNFSIPVTVVASPVANFTVTPDCAGSSFNFTNTTTGGSNQNVYDWDFGGGNTSQQTSPSIVFNTAGTINVKLRVTEGSCMHDTIKPVVVFPNPKPDFSASVLCFGDSTQFTDNSSIASGAVTSWLWDFGGGNTSTLQNPKFKFASGGLQTVKLKVTSGNNCSKDTTKTIIINEKPVANFVRVDTACLNAPVSFRDSSYFVSNVSNSTIAQWWWSPGNAAVFNTSQITTTYNSAPVSYLMQQVVVSDKGCYSDTNKQMVNVKTLPVAQIGMSSPVCFNREVSFTDLTPNSFSRNWTLSNGFISQQRSFKVNNLLIGTNTVQLKVLDSFGCQGNTYSQNFTVHPKPSFRFIYTDSCIDKIVPFKAVDLNGNYISKWKWSFENYYINGAANQDHLFSRPGNNTVYLYAEAVTGCISDTVQQRIFIYHTNAFAGEDRIAAPNEAIQLFAKGGNTYEWTPNYQLNNSMLQNPVATLSADQIYKVKVTSDKGCAASDDVKITVYKGPDIYIPTIFTPNRDGKNDDLKITLVGIKEFKYLSVFDRFGNRVFYTNDAGKAWDGTVKNKNSQTETYVWMCEGVDIYGKTIFKKGTLIIIR